MRKRFSIAILVVVLSLCFTGVCYATYLGWAPSVEWNTSTAQKDFSPEWGNTSMYGYNSGGLLYVDPCDRFRWSQTRINNLREYGYDSFMYTNDISVPGSNTTISATSTYDFYSNLPNPYFDIDDDPFPSGNGYNDEAEVTCQNPYQLVANTDYRFDSCFRVYSTSSIQFQFGSQLSYFGQSIDDEIHKYRNYPW